MNNVEHIKAIWVTWHEHRRTRSLVEHLQVPVAVYDNHRTFWRYTEGPVWTLRTLISHRSNVVYTHFSYALLLTIMIYKYMFRLGRVKVIADCHNKALKRELARPFGGLFRLFKRTIFRGVDLIVVTNPMIAPLARRLCRRVTVLRDPLTDWKGEDQKVRESGVNKGGHVFFICSFDKDEPVDLIFCTAEEVTRRLGRSVFISGRVPTSIVPKAISQNNDIVLPGFMPLQQYKDLLFTAAAVVVLTEDDDCLVCGAYESLGANRPTVLSATTGLQACFGAAAYYSEHSTDKLVAGIATAIGENVDKENARRQFQDAWLKEWDNFKSDVQKVVPK